MNFQDKVAALRKRHEELLSRKNIPMEWGNGIYDKYQFPILTADHTPLEWRYDFSEQDNPYLMQRIMINSAFNSGAIKLDGKYLLVVRVEGADRKSFFAVAESPDGIGNFRFWDEPITMPEAPVLSPEGEVVGTDDATNIYDMRLTQHEDGWIYGLFCAERHDDSMPGDLSAATATCGIARTKDLKTWERLPDLKAQCQQRNVCLHPEFIYTDEMGNIVNREQLQDGIVNGKLSNAGSPDEIVNGKLSNAGSSGEIVNGKSSNAGSPDEIVNGKLSNCKCSYALYTRPQDGFIDAGSGGGIGWALVDDMTHAEVKEEKIISSRRYHTIMEVKNGEGPHPIKTPQGWLHLAHGVRGCASGLRYVLYLYMTALDDPTRVIAQPGGYFLVPEGYEYVGDVMNVAFANGWIADEDGRVLIYYASCDTRMHVAVSTIDKLVDYCLHTPADGYRTGESVETIKALIRKNKSAK